MASGLEKIDAALTGLGQPIAAEVARLLEDFVQGNAGRFSIELEEPRPKHLVYRVLAKASHQSRSLIIKRLDPDAAKRNRLAVRRWLPWLGFERATCNLLAAAATPNGDHVWHVYEDVGGTRLHEHRSDRERVEAAVRLVAELHTRAAGHPVVAECRRDGYDLGMPFFTNNVSDALSVLDALRPPAVPATREQADVRDRLRHRLSRLLNEVASRARTLAEAAGPVTMLHGDLWTTNFILTNRGEWRGVRLIDWDHVGAGPFSYDLSIFLLRFPAAERLWVLDRYREAVARAGWRLPAAPQLNELFETAEYARYANRIVWPAIALLHDGEDWGFPELAEIDGWFEALRPVLPE